MSVGPGPTGGQHPVGGLRFAFYWRCSTEDHQGPVTSRAWQLGQALATVGAEGQIVVEFSDVGKSSSMSPLRARGRRRCWRRRPTRTTALTPW